MCGSGNTWGTRGTTLGDTTMWCGKQYWRKLKKKPHEEQIETQFENIIGNMSWNHVWGVGGGNTWKLGEQYKEFTM